MLHTRLNSHDNELPYLFDKFIVLDLVWSEELFEILAYLKEKTYKPSSLTNELRTIFMKAYVTLEEKKPGQNYKKEKLNKQFIRIIMICYKKLVSCLQ